MEIWKDIEDWKGSYQASSSGTIKSIKFDKERTLTARVRVKGHPVVTLRDGARKACYVAALVIDSFLPKDPLKRCIRHKDRDNSNNKIENLEWALSASDTLYAAKI